MQTYQRPVPHWASLAERKLWDLNINSDDDCRFRHNILQECPEEFANALADRYQQKWHAESPRAANLYLLNSGQSVTKSLIKLASDDQQLCDNATTRANACRRMAARNHHLGEDKIFQSLSSYVTEFALTPPSLKKITVPGAIARMQCDKWWRRQLRKVHARKMEATAIELGFVHKKISPYVSRETLKRRRQQLARFRSLLEVLQATNELGESFTLQELVDSTTSNPTLRRYELMTRIAGLEQLAEQQGHTGLFLTLTCPSRFHARFAASGALNPKYDGSTPLDAQRYLNQVWARTRAAFDRQSMKPYGVRVVEAHHDGTPHWHLLLFIPKYQAKELISIFRGYALAENGNEPGAKERRFKVVPIDKSKGTAAGYIAKYISKNLDAHGVDADLYGFEAKDSAERVNAWATTWGIRQFQQFGGAPVSIWRELRRIRELPEEHPMFNAWHAADNGQWDLFVKAMGGTHARRDEHPITLHRVWNDKPNGYNEPIGYQIIGLLCGDEAVTTRFHTWSIELINSDVCGELTGSPCGADAVTTRCCSDDVDFLALA